MSEKKADGILEKKRTFKDYFMSIGPAIIIAAVVIGPGSVTTLSTMGAAYGYDPLWVIVFACFASYLYQEPAIRLVCERQMSVMDAARKKYNPAVPKFLFILLYLGTLVFQASNFIGAAMSMNYFVPGLSIVAWTNIMIISALAMALMSKQDLLENFTKVLVGLMVVSFVITAFSPGPSVGDLIKDGFSFRIPGGNWFLVIALLGTTMVPDIPVSLSALLKGKFMYGRPEEVNLPTLEKKKSAVFDLLVSLTVTAMISIAILVCSGSVLHPLGIQVKSASDMARQLTPLLGRYAGILFSLGLWGAAFSSGLFRMLLMPMIFNQAWGYEEDLKAARSRIISIGAGVVPMIIVFVFGSAPIWLVLSAQAINGMMLPAICFIVWRISADKDIMGDKVNTSLRNILLAGLFVITLFLSLRTFLSIIS